MENEEIEEVEYWGDKEVSKLLCENYEVKMSNFEYKRK